MIKEIPKIGEGAKANLDGFNSSLEQVDANFEELDTKLSEGKTYIDTHRTYTLTHSKSGTKHTFSDLPTGQGIYQCQFIANADYNEGDTFTGYTAKPTGEETILTDKAFVTGDLVSITVDTVNKKLGFKIGGGGGDFPKSWQDRQTGRALENINKNDLIAYKKGGGWDKAIYNVSSLTSIITECVSNIAISPDGKFVAIAEGWNSIIHVFKFLKNGFKLVYWCNLCSDSKPTSCALAFSPNGKFFAMSPFYEHKTTVFKIEGDKFTEIFKDVRDEPVCSVSFSPRNNYLALGGYPPKAITVYKINGDKFTKTFEKSITASKVKNLTFSNDEKYLALTLIGKPYLEIYKIINYDFIKLPNPNIIPPDNGFGIVFSPNDKLLVVGHTGGKGIIVYKIGNDKFSSIGLPSKLSCLTLYSISFTTDGLYMALGFDTSPYFAIIKIVGDDFIITEKPTVLPTGSVKGLTFDKTDTKLLLGSSQAPYTLGYETLKESLVYKPTSFVKSIGMALETKKSNEQIKVNLFPPINDLEG